MAAYIGESQLCVVIALLVWMYNPIESKGISFRLQGDDVIFEGDATVLFCGYSSDTLSNPNITITGEVKELHMLTVTSNDTFTEIFGLYVLPSGHYTFLCTVESDNSTETSTLYITVLPREFPYCTSNTSNEVIEGDRILLSCYVETDTNKVMWVTNTSDIIQNNTMLVPDQRKKQAVIRPFENETGSTYTCVAPSSERNISECSLGPISVYKRILIIIQPQVMDVIRLHPGQSHELQCTSKPRSVIHWKVSYKPNYVDAIVDGPLVKIVVHSNNTEAGTINLTCVGMFHNHINSRVVQVQLLQGILNRESGSSINSLYIIAGSVAVLLILTFLTLLSICCLKHRSTTEEDSSDIYVVPSLPKTETPIPVYANTTDTVYPTENVIYNNVKFDSHQQRCAYTNVTRSPYSIPIK